MVKQAPISAQQRRAARNGGGLAVVVLALVLVMFAIILLAWVIGPLGAATGAVAAFTLADAARNIGARSLRRRIAEHRAARAVEGMARVRLMLALRVVQQLGLADVTRQSRLASPPARARSGRALPSMNLTPRLLAQRPQLARAARARLAC